MVDKTNLQPRGSTAARGERQGMSKLKESEVLEIIELVNSREYTITSIARTFSITTTNIRSIMRGETWSWLTGILNE